MRPIISSRKLIKQIPVDTVTGGTIKNIVLANAKQDADHTVSNEVNVGSLVKAIYVEIWITADMAQPGSITVTLEKLPGVAPLMTFIQQSTLHTYPNKNNVLYITQGLIGDSNANPIPFLRKWFAIPKGKQRMAINERLVLNINANFQDAVHCGTVILKSYT